MKYVNLENIESTKRFVYQKRVPFDLGDAKFQIVLFEHNKPIRPHHHKLTTEVFLIRNGVGVITVNGDMYVAGHNDMFLIEPGDSHSIISTQDYGLTIAIFKPIEHKNDIYWD